MTLSELIKFNRLKAETFRHIGLNPYQKGNSEILSLIRLGDKIFHCN